MVDDIVIMFTSAWLVTQMDATQRWIPPYRPKCFLAHSSPLAFTARGLMFASFTLDA